MAIFNLIRHSLFAGVILVGFCQLFFTLLLTAILVFVFQDYPGSDLLLWGELIVVLSVNYFYGHKRRKFFECMYGNLFMLAWMMILLSILSHSGGKSTSISDFYSVFPGAYFGTFLLISLRRKSL